MLIELSIRDFVLIRQLDLELADGFTSLTGETGAGKSILLAALGFALGARTGQGAIRPGAEGMSVSAIFDAPAAHGVRAFLGEHGVCAPEDEPLVFRRVMRRGGAARAFVNDQSVSASLLEEAGRRLVEIHGQHASLGLMEAARQRARLDAFAGAAGLLADMAGAHAAWREAAARCAEIEETLARAETDRVFLEHALEELDRLNPDEGECESLARLRAQMQSGERVVEAIEGASAALARAGVEQALSAAARSVGRAMASPGLSSGGSQDGDAAGDLGARVRAAADALERALIEAAEARTALDLAAAACEFSPAALEHAEQRLFALKAAARKHNVDPAGLPALRAGLRERLEALDQSGAALARARADETRARAACAAAADRLSARRAEAAVQLAAAMHAELRPLRLEKVRFRVAVARLPLEEAGPAGQDDVRFEIATHAAAAFAPMSGVASGGELARIALALAVCLSRSHEAATLIFDEADVGVGGAVAAAIGERFARLGRDRQVLAITHSPQVAACADRHLRISKDEDGSGATATAVSALDHGERLEEIARMLAGAEVTAEARAAADRLLVGRLP